MYILHDYLSTSLPTYSLYDASQGLGLLSLATRETTTVFTDLSQYRGVTMV